MASKQNIDEADDDLELQLKLLLERIRDEPVPEEIRALACQLEAALRKQEESRNLAIRDESR